MTNLKELYHDIKAVQQSGQKRWEILIIQLYIEHFINEIINEISGTFPKEVIREKLTIPTKTHILLENNIINKDHKRIIDILAKTRNDLVHNLTLDINDIEKRLKHANFEFIKDKNKKRIHIFKHLKPYDRLTTSSIIIISLLYHNLHKIKHEPSTQYLKLQIKKHNDTYIPIFTFFEENTQ